MPTFENSDRLQQVLGGFFEYLLSDPQMGPKLINSKLVLKFNYKEPDLSITVDLSREKPEITFNDASKSPEVEMSMKADIAHRFWMGKVNLMIALARREMVAKGPIPKILRLLPIIKPAYQMYPNYLKEKGFSGYLSVL
ncbi:MAG: SCP2 sterol-binding domain-containing protein [Deltaproteobacteria bacterium]|nr:SCP2 sterol-binding domain-containing protein [Deltaproteobacteria bacterium]